MDALMKDVLGTSRKNANKDDKDLYMRMKELESELEILSIQEEYLKDE